MYFLICKLVNDLEIDVHLNRICHFRNFNRSLDLIYVQTSRANDVR